MTVFLFFKCEWHWLPNVLHPDLHLKRWGVLLVRNIRACCKSGFSTMELLAKADCLPTRRSVSPTGYLALLEWLSSILDAIWLGVSWKLWGHNGVACKGTLLCFNNWGPMLNAIWLRVPWTIRQLGFYPSPLLGRVWEMVLHESSLSSSDVSRELLWQLSNMTLESNFFLQILGICSFHQKRYDTLSPWRRSKGTLHWTDIQSAPLSSSQPGPFYISLHLFLWKKLRFRVQCTRLFTYFRVICGGSNVHLTCSVMLNKIPSSEPNCASFHAECNSCSCSCVCCVLSAGDPDELTFLKTSLCSFPSEEWKSRCFLMLWEMQLRTYSTSWGILNGLIKV